MYKWQFGKPNMEIWKTHPSINSQICKLYILISNIHMCVVPGPASQDAVFKREYASSGLPCRGLPPWYSRKSALFLGQWSIIFLWNTLPMSCFFDIDCCYFWLINHKNRIKPSVCGSLHVLATIANTQVWKTDSSSRTHSTTAERDWLAGLYLNFKESARRNIQTFEFWHKQVGDRKQWTRLYICTL